jgi:hydroxypyruvate isomerase
MAIKQSVSWWCYEKTGIAPADLMRSIAAIGYQGVELLPQEHFALAKDNGLEIAAIQGHFPLEDGLNKPQNAARIEAQLRERLAQAAEWHIPNLIVFSGNRNGLDDQRGAELTAGLLAKLAPLAEQAGIMLALELLNSKVDHPDYQCDRTAWGIQVCQMVNSPAVKLLYDIYHMQIMEGDIIQTIRDQHQWFAHYHTGGVPGRAEIDETQELYYPAIVQAIEATRYTGWLGQEFVPRGDPIAGLKRAFSICGGVS